jgi:hypothetical protein
LVKNVMKKPGVLERQCAEMKAQRQGIVAKPSGGADRAGEFPLAKLSNFCAFVWRGSPEPGDPPAKFGRP